MRRVIYCPEDIDSSAAESMARDFGLPLQVGDCQSSSFLEFDRSTIQVLTIPTDHGISFLEKALPGEMIWINVISDMFDFLHTKPCLVIKLINKNVFYVDPQIAEQHYCRFLYMPQSPGSYEFDILLSENIIFSGLFDIV